MFPALLSPISQIVRNNSSLGLLLSILQSQFPCFALMVSVSLKRCADAHPLYYLDAFLHLGNPLSRIAEFILV